MAFSHQLPEPGVAQAARGLFNRLRGLAGVGLRFGGDIDAGLVERETEPGGKFSRKGQVGVCFFASQPVVEMGGVDDQPEFGGTRRNGAEKGYRVRAAGEADGKSEARFEQSDVDTQI
jgi:hypothetical protein